MVLLPRNPCRRFRPESTERSTISTAPALPARPTDEELVHAIAHDDQNAFAELFDRFGAGLNGLALRILRDPTEAEDVVAESFAQVWREAERFDDLRGSAAAWLVTMARSRALDALRASKRRDRLDTAAINESVVGTVAMGRAPLSPDKVAVRSERARLVRGALNALPDEQRIVIEMAYFGGLSQQEIALTISAPLGTVKTRARLALAKLQGVLQLLAPESADD